MADIDGVLNCASTRVHVPGTRYIGLDSILVKRFKNIIKRTGASIVISSTWRKYPEFMSHLKTKLGKKISEKIIDQTPILSLQGSRPRSDEIDAWLAEHPEVDNFIVIDDLSGEGLEKYGERFIHTSELLGITEDDMKKSIKLLMEK